MHARVHQVYHGTEGLQNMLGSAVFDHYLTII
jgi:hypothetical protein